MSDENLSIRSGCTPTACVGVRPVYGKVHSDQSAVGETETWVPIDYVSRPPRPGSCALMPSIASSRRGIVPSYKRRRQGGEPTIPGSQMNSSSLLQVMKVKVKVRNVREARKVSIVKLINLPYCWGVTIPSLLQECLVGDNLLMILSFVK